MEVFKVLCKSFTYGGEAPKDQRIYYFNTKEIVGNKYGTPTKIPFRVVDRNIGLDMDISISCFGEYSFRLSNPLLFYTNVCGNITSDYTVSQLQSQMRTELLTALQPAFARISELGIRYSSLPGHTPELADALNAELSPKWRDFRGIEIVSIGVSSVKANEEDEKLIKELQRNAAFKNPAMAAAHLVGAQASAMQAAASNEGTGAAMGFVGMNMAASSGGIQAQTLYELAKEQNEQNKEPSDDSWICPACKKSASGNFCRECGTKKPEPVITAGWECPNCGTVNKGKFCSECGCKKPQGAPLYRCDKCGWEPEDPVNPPRFCPECGDPFDESDRVN
jgi:membrane protease subunit (stomatin/prohibitin family)